MAIVAPKSTNVEEAVAMAREVTAEKPLENRNIRINTSQAERDLVRAAVRAALQGESLADFDLYNLAALFDSIQIGNCPDLGIPLNQFVHGQLMPEKEIQLFLGIVT